MCGGIIAASTQRLYSENTRKGRRDQHPVQQTVSETNKAKGNRSHNKLRMWWSWAWVERLGRRGRVAQDRRREGKKGDGRERVGKTAKEARVKGEGTGSAQSLMCATGEGWVIYTCIKRNL